MIIDDLNDNLNASEMLSIYSVFADTNDDDSTSLRKNIDVRRPSADDSNVIISNAHPFEMSNLDNFDLNPLPLPPSMEEQLLLNVDVTTVSINSETEYVSYEMGELCVFMDSPYRVCSTQMCDIEHILIYDVYICHFRLLKQIQIVNNGSIHKTLIYLLMFCHIFQLSMDRMTLISFRSVCTFLLLVR